MDVAAPFFGGVREILEIVATQWIKHWDGLWPWLAFWFGLHALVEYGIPALFGPGVFDFLSRDGKITDRRILAQDARTKVIATFQAVYVTVACVYGFFDPNEYARLRLDPYATSPLTYHVAYLAAAYFAWDVIICFLDGYPFEFHIHAWIAFLSFSTALVRRCVGRYVSCHNAHSAKTWTSSHSHTLTTAIPSVVSLLIIVPRSNRLSTTWASFPCFSRRAPRFCISERGSFKAETEADSCFK